MWNDVNAWWLMAWSKELWDFGSSAIDKFSITWRKALRRSWSLHYRTHGYLLALVSDCLPLLDSLCLHFLSFSSSCMLHESRFIQNITRFTVYYGGTESLVRKMFMFCKDRCRLSSADLFTRYLLRTKVFNCAKNQLSTSQFFMGNLLRDLILIREQTYEFSGRSSFMTNDELVS